MANNNKPSEKKQVFDVSKPGKSAPDASARPIIAGHKMMKDPMVSSDDEQEDSGQKVDVRVSSSGKSVVPPSTSKAVIEPPADDEDKQSVAAEKDDKEEKPKEPKQESPADEKAAEEPKASESNGEESHSEEQTDESSAVVGAVAEQAEAKKKKSESSEQNKARLEAYEKIIEQKKYFVKVKSVGRKRRSKILLLTTLFVLVFGSAGALLAADAGLIDLGFDPPFNIIKDKSG